MSDSYAEGGCADHSLCRFDQQCAQSHLREIDERNAPHKPACRFPDLSGADQFGGVHLGTEHREVGAIVIAHVGSGKATQQVEFGKAKPPFFRGLWSQKTKLLIYGTF